MAKTYNERNRHLEEIIRKEYESRKTKEHKHAVYSNLRKRSDKPEG